MNSLSLKKWTCGWNPFCLSRCVIYDGRIDIWIVNYNLSVNTRTKRMFGILYDRINILFNIENCLFVSYANEPSYAHLTDCIRFFLPNQATTNQMHHCLQSISCLKHNGNTTYVQLDGGGVFYLLWIFFYVHYTPLTLIKVIEIMIYSPLKDFLHFSPLIQPFFTNILHSLRAHIVFYRFFQSTRCAVLFKAKPTLSFDTVSIIVSHPFEPFMQLQNGKKAVKLKWNDVVKRMLLSHPSYCEFLFMIFIILWLIPVVNSLSLSAPAYKWFFLWARLRGKKKTASNTAKVFMNDYLTAAKAIHFEEEFNDSNGIHSCVWCGKLQKFYHNTQHT